MRLLRVAADDGDQRVAQGLELGLGVGVEEGDGGEVDRVRGVRGVDDDCGAGRGSLASAADADASEEVLGVLQVGLLLGTAQAFALLGLGLVVARFIFAFFCAAGLLGQLFGNALRPGLLVRGGFSCCLGLGLLGLFGLLALDIGVFGGVPRV